jgi:hypothetical protein
VVTKSLGRSFWRTAIWLYAVCALGNLLVLCLPMAPAVVRDVTGTAWNTMEILGVGGAISAVVMGTMALVAWLRTEDSHRGD